MELNMFIFIFCREELNNRFSICCAAGGGKYLFIGEKLSQKQA